MADTEMTETREETESEEARQPEPAQMEANYPPPPVPTRTAAPQARTPLLAGIFSVFPGLGNVYNGLYLRGATFFLIFFGLILVASGTEPPEAVILVFSIIFVWLFNIFDAYRQATFINLGFQPDLSFPSKSRATSWGSGGMVAGIAVFLLGLYGLLREQFDFDFTFLVDHWYVLFMAFGAFLIAQTVIQKKRAEETTAGDLESSDLEI